MSATNSVTLTFGYEDTNFTRRYKFEDVSAAGLSGIVARIKAINESLAGGTDGGLSTFFLSDEGDNFTGIIAAQSDVGNVEVINLNESE